MGQKISLLVLVDSSQAVSYSVLEETMFSALNHFGMPYNIFDLNRGGFHREDLSDCGGIVIAQENIGNSFLSSDIQMLLGAVHKGVGLVNFDNRIDKYLPPYREMLGVDKPITQTELTGVVITSNQHYITRDREAGEKVNFFQLVAFQQIEKTEGSILLEGPGKEIATFAINYGSGRVVQCLLSPRIWLLKHLGHGNGLDDIFWKSIIWTTKKPFAMKAMPPFVTARIDDVSGSNSQFGKSKKSANYHFQYLDKFNEHGYISNVGLYIDDISPEDSKIIRSKYNHKQAEFSPHAFKDPKNIADQLIYMKHVGEEFSDEELKGNFKRVDGKFSGWGIKPSNVLNAHFGAVGVNALPFLKARGQVYIPMGLEFGKAWANQEGWNWRPKPFGHLGYMCDYIPDHKDFFCVTSNLNMITNPNLPRKDDSAAPNFDFLFSCTPFWKENPYNNVRKAAERGAEQIKRGLDNLFFGCLFTHEQRIAALSTEEWDEILSQIDILTSKYNKIFKGYDYIAHYAKNKVESLLTKAEYIPEAKKIECHFEGKTDMVTKLYLFIEKKGEIEYTLKDIPPFQNFINVSFEL